MKRNLLFLTFSLFLSNALSAQVQDEERICKADVDAVKIYTSMSLDALNDLFNKIRNISDPEEFSWVSSYEFKSMVEILGSIEMETRMR